MKFSDQKSPTGPIKNRLLNLINSATPSTQPIGLGQAANFILADQRGPVYAVLNGFLVDLRKDVGVLPNSYGY